MQYFTMALLQQRAQGPAVPLVSSAAQVSPAQTLPGPARMV